MAAYEIPVDGVINQQAHQRMTNGEVDRAPSKNPAMFGIDLHVDDLEGVRLEGEAHGFSVVVVTPDDTNWVTTVLQAADAARNADAVRNSAEQLTIGKTDD